MATSIAPGLVALHGNCTETLADALIAWFESHPLAPLEQETVLVQSNGTAEWFKMRMAEHSGVCAAAKVELPARFIWRTYRHVLQGQRSIPRISPLDEQPMTWRLMRLLPQCIAEPAFEPLARFLRPGEPQRMLQLATRLSDLFDQYQVYRADWLHAWEQGRDVLPGIAGKPDLPLPEGQAWQPCLWRTLLADLTDAERQATRTAVRADVMERLRSADVGSLPVARRVVLFGLSHVPLAFLEFLAALSRHSQVVLAVPNPCRYHWADAISGRELLLQQRRRHALRGGTDLASVPLDAMHAHAHPLLAAWGRQSRDYVRLLDDFDTTHDSASSLNWPRVDLFDDAPANTGSLLEQVQRSIRDLLPLGEHPRATQPDAQIAAHDHSIVFHRAHSLVRELEVLHDQLLHMLAQPPAAGKAPLQPRDVIVMLPDIAQAAPSIRAVFGQYALHDPRYIPFDISDLAAHASSPLVTALQWLLKLPQQRCRLSELCDLLDVPALAARLGLALDDVPQLRQWMAGAGIRWGLNLEQRRSLHLEACGEHNSAWFGLRRMLLGYASGSQSLDGRSAAWEGIEPYDEVGGLDAELAGVLAALLERLLRWWSEALEPATPDVWALRLRSLVQDLFAAQDDVEHAVLDGLDQALTCWQEACDHAHYTAVVPLAVAQEAWLNALEQPSLEQRFRAGGVTFATPMPMRAIPFEVVCLLGMNDGEFPRSAMRSDFDLMQHKGQYRPGDRARRDHDRQLMLEALLSARRTLYISWAGHHVRDNSEQPPSVLVSQLRDYLAAGWCGEQDLLAERTWDHPLQPFSRAYFEDDAKLRTYAAEWRDAHVPAAVVPHPAQTVAASDDTAVPLTVQRLSGFLSHPVRYFFQQRLSVHFPQGHDTLDDAEVFGFDGLENYVLNQDLQTQVTSQWAAQADWQWAQGDAVEVLLDAQLQRLQGAGALPLAGMGVQEMQRRKADLVPCLHAWMQLLQHYAQPAERRHLALQQEGV
ncbi:MAG: exodeoxyribonuclease V subunit gamma, partial [Comamonas sp.]